MANGMGRTGAVLAVLLAACGGDSSPVTDHAGVDAATDAQADSIEQIDVLDAGDTAAPDSRDSTATDADSSDGADPDADAGNGSGEGAWLREAPAPWIPAGAVVVEHPAAYARISRWVQRTEAGARATTGRLAAYGVGNGRSFALVGMARPFTTLHGIEGPSYDRGDRYFSDHVVELVDGAGETLERGAELVAMSLSAPVVVTETVFGEYRLRTHVFAPWSNEGPPPACIIRLLELECAFDGCAPEARVQLRGVLAVSAEGSPLLVERVDGRVLESAFDVDVDVALGERSISTTMALGEVLTLTHCMRMEADPATQIDDAGALLDQAVEAWAAWADDTVQVELDEPMLEDFINGMKLTLRLQRSSSGASSPMSSYTRTWPRDNVGPVMALLALGAHDDVRDQLDYLYAAAIDHGDFKNSYRADLDVSAVGPAPDWDALAPLPRRESAETPSYLVRMLAAYARATGDTGVFDRDRGYVERALLAQTIEESGLLPFTGDETYRAAMNAAFGYDLEFAHHEESLSLGSSLLWLGAARDARPLAEAAGFDEFVDRIDAIEPLVRSGLDAYALDGGCMAALVVRATGEAFERVFEDVSLTPVWSGAMDRDDAAAVAAIACAYEALRVAPGIARSPLDARYEPSGPIVFGTREGVFTGMLPGYTLSALTEIGHADAHAALVAAIAALDASGNAQEYQIADDNSGLSLIYDATGETGDYTAKYRPWEGGIVAAAVIDHLTGFVADALEGSVSLRPHLPDSMRFSRWTGLRVGDSRFDLAIERSEEGDLRVASTATFDDELRWLVRVDGVSSERIRAPSGATLDEGGNSTGARWVDVRWSGSADWTLDVLPAPPE